jgi:hypothetical protein
MKWKYNIWVRVLGIPIPISWYENLPERFRNWLVVRDMKRKRAPWDGMTGKL